MVSSHRSSRPTSEEIFREVDQYDPLAEVASGSGEHLETKGVSSRLFIGGDGAVRNQLGFYHSEEPLRTCDPWFDLYPSWLDSSDEVRTRALSHAPSDYKFMFLHSEERTNTPPPGYYTFYQDQLEGGLRFPLPHFFQQLSQFYQIHLGQFTPNAFRTLCNFVVLFKALVFEVDPLSFSHFYLPKMSEECPFYFSARPNCQFFEGVPSSNKFWKNHYFFVQPSDSWDICSQWRAALPELPSPPPGFRKSFTFLGPFVTIRGRRFHTPTLLAEDLLCYYGLSSAKVSPQDHEGNRVMNALIKKVAARKKQKASSEGADKGKAVAAEVSREEVPVVTIVEALEAPLSSSRKRRAPEIPCLRGQSASSEELDSFQTDAEPLRQVRSDTSSKVLRCRSNLFDMYREDLRIVGVGPSPLAGAVLRDVASTADADFLHGLSWSDLIMRSNSATAEAALLNAEVTFRATNLQKQSSKDARTFEVTSAEMEQKLADITSALEKEVANAKRREDDMSQGFAAEALKLKNELRLMEVRLEAAQEELRLAQQVAASARADLAKGSEVFKEAFLKSAEFEHIIGDKALGFLEVGFNGCVAQFKAAGYPPEGTSADFLSVKQILDNLPPDDGHDPENTKQSTTDMTAFVQNLLQQMQTRFQTMSESIISKIDEMGNRIDELELSINDLRTEMGQEGSPSPSAPLKAKEEPKSADE